MASRGVFIIDLYVQHSKTDFEFYRCDVLALVMLSIVVVGT